jgi:tRNA wybutosine-synthesizing protein 3
MSESLKNLKKSQAKKTKTSKKIVSKVDAFEMKKKACLEKLYKPDRSRKGEVDKALIPLINYLNTLCDYYTTSSCSGRIQILTESDKKPDVKWLYVSHEKVDLKDIEKVLCELNLKEYPNDRIWLRQENLILHVVCKNIGAANNILKIARDIGLRRSGIIADSNQIVVEICSTEKMDVPVAEKGKMLVDKKYISIITDIANKKFSIGREKLLLLESEIKSKLK